METLQLEHAAKFLLMSSAKLGQLARMGKVKAAKPGKRWVFLKSDLVDYLNNLYSVRGNTPQLVGNSEESLCQYSNVEPRGGLTSRRLAEKEYAAQLGLRKRS